MALSWLRRLVDTLSDCGGKDADDVALITLLLFGVSATYILPGPG